MIQRSNIPIVRLAQSHTYYLYRVCPVVDDTDESSSPFDNLDEVRLTAEDWNRMPSGRQGSPPARQRLLEVASSSKTLVFPAFTGEETSQLALLPGKAWLVYLLLLRQCRIRRDATVCLTSRVRRAYHVTHNDTTRGLHHLADVGMITVEPLPGKTPMVTVTEPSRQAWLTNLPNLRSARKRG
jgi:hypothetical protein